MRGPGFEPGPPGPKPGILDQARPSPLNHKLLLELDKIKDLTDWKTFTHIHQIYYLDINLINLT